MRLGGILNVDQTIWNEAAHYTRLMTPYNNAICNTVCNSHILAFATNQTFESLV